jgi:hypothetical protein
LVEKNLLVLAKISEIGSCKVEKLMAALAANLKAASVN